MNAARYRVTLAMALAVASLHTRAHAQSGGDQEPAAPVLTRTMLRAVAKRGAGPLLAKLEFAERPVFRDGRFVGLRLLARHDDGVSRALFDLRAGDVVTAVNGIAPRTPEDLATIVRRLPEGPEVTIEFLREGKARRSVTPITDGP